MPIDTQYLAGEKQQRRQRLVLCARRDLRIGRQAGEERLDLRLAHLRRMALARMRLRIQLIYACWVRGSVVRCPRAVAHLIK